MDDVTRHPDDATLFDLVEGALDDAATVSVQAHLSRCAACAAFVAAARAGGPATTHALEAMPEAASERLQAAVRTAWRDRVSGIAQDEAVADAAPSTGTGEFAGFAPGANAVATEPIDVDAPEPRVRPTRRRGRRLVPVLAFVVLGTLAGTSIYIGEDAQRPGGDASSQEEQFEGMPTGPAGVVSAPQAGEPEALEAPASGGAAASAEDSAAPPGIDGEAGVDTSSEQAGRNGAATSGAAVTAEPPPSDYDEFVDQDRTCVVTVDETQLVLPNQRLPTQIEEGPFGLYLVCG